MRVSQLPKITSSLKGDRMMDSSVREYIENYSLEIIEMYKKLRELILESTSQQIEEKLWAKLPSYYVGEKFVRLIPFKDHINIEAMSIMQHKNELTGYKITPKGMLQIYLNQTVPLLLLEKIFDETLNG